MQIMYLGVQIMYYILASKADYFANVSQWGWQWVHTYWGHSQGRDHRCLHQDSTDKRQLIHVSLFICWLALARNWDRFDDVWNTGNLLLPRCVQNKSFLQTTVFSNWWRQEGRNEEGTKKVCLVYCWLSACVVCVVCIAMLRIHMVCCECRLQDQLRRIKKNQEREKVDSVYAKKKKLAPPTVKVFHFKVKQASSLV